MIKPNFFIIGAPKSGTTALSEYLSEHPNVFFSRPKELGYFATDFKTRVVTNERDYLRLFRSADPSRHLAIGEGSAYYVFSRVAVSNILRFQPNAKFILMLRNPVELVVSFHAQTLAEGYENLRSFLSAWNAESDRKLGKRIPAGCREPQRLYYSEWGKLGSQLKRVLDVVPEAQLKVILFDDFISNTRCVYRDVLAFLGVPDDGRTEFPKVNTRRLPKNPYFQSLLGTLMHFWLPLQVKLLGGRGFGIATALRRWSTVPAENLISPEVHRMLVDFYRDEIVLLQSLLNRDLQHWLGEVG